MLATKHVGRTEVEVTRLGFGGGPLGGLYAPVDDESAAVTLAAAWECDIRYFDTSPHYGIGVSERWIGRLLIGKSRAEYTLGAAPAAAWSSSHRTSASRSSASAGTSTG